MPAWRWVAVLAGVLGASGVALAAVGAHVTAGENPAAWQAASLMHLVHAVAVLTVAALLRQGAGRLWLGVVAAMAAGVLLFSGSIYRAGLLGLDSSGPLAPVGGSLLIFAWLLLAVAAWRSKS